MSTPLRAFVPCRPAWVMHTFPSLSPHGPAWAVGLLKPRSSSVGLQEARKKGRAFKGGRVGHSRWGPWGAVWPCTVLVGLLGLEDHCRVVHGHFGEAWGSMELGGWLS